MPKFPHYRHLLVKNSTLGVDSLVDAVLIKNEDGSESMAASRYECAQALYLSPVKKNYLDASLIATEDLAEISEMLDIPVEILSTYRSFFFEVTGFNKLSKLALIEEYDESGRDLLVWALSASLDFLRWRLGQSIDINPIQGLQDLFSLSTYKTKEAMMTSSGSVGSLEAVKWATISMGLAKLLKAYTMDSNAARNDIELALGKIEPSFKGFSNLDF